MDCIFCKIARGDLGTTLVLEEERVVAFRDISPQAPTHVLVCPREHLGSLDELRDAGLAGELLLAAARVAAREGLGGGWRLIANTGPDGGQEVSHLHLHVLGGRRLGRMLERPR